MRAELAIIEDWIKPGSRVLDLGCGDGSLLQYLKREKRTTGIGLEIDPDNSDACLAKGIDELEQDLNKGLSNFHDRSFDTVVMTQTLQTVRYPGILIDEMLRIGHNCVVTFPNFGNWRTRAYLLVHGRMPVSESMPYQWYDTPNIHFCTVRDFDIFCAERDIRVITREVLDYNHRGTPMIRLLPNLLSEVAIYHITR